MTTLRWTTAGESHGAALVGVLEGLPSGLAIDLARVDAELARRQGGHGRGGRMKIESDRIELLSGLRAGRTLGSPLSFAIRNADATIERLPVPTNARPGHADLAGCQKYGVRDPRAVLERASARETAARVALGALARQLLDAFGIEVFASVRELGGVACGAAAFAGPAAERRALREKSAFYTLDPSADERMLAAVEAARAAGDSLGGVFEVRVSGLPPGLGSYQNPSERLTARLGAALFSIPAIKGVEFGVGFEAARLPGSRMHDAILGAPGADGPGGGRYRRESNRAGGLEGGLSTGEELVVRAAMKPIPTLRQGSRTVDFETLEPVAATYQRSDVTSVPAASVVGEAVVALELSAAFLAKFGGDSLAEVEASFASWRARLGSV
jgi:chorismate synthase